MNDCIEEYPGFFWRGRFCGKLEIPCCYQSHSFDLCLLHSQWLSLCIPKVQAADVTHMGSRLWLNRWGRTPERAVAYFSAYSAFLGSMWNSAEGLFLGGRPRVTTVSNLTGHWRKWPGKGRLEKLKAAKLGVKILKNYFIYRWLKPELRKLNLKITPGNSGPSILARKSNKSSNHVSALWNKCQCITDREDIS